MSSRNLSGCGGPLGRKLAPVERVAVAPGALVDGGKVRMIDQQTRAKVRASDSSGTSNSGPEPSTANRSPRLDVVDQGVDEAAGLGDVRRPGAALAHAPRPKSDRPGEMAGKPRRRAPEAPQLGYSFGQHQQS